MEKNKIAIKETFSRNYNTYSHEAIVQAVMADKLIEFIMKFVGKDFNSILEIGCGTGFVSKQISEKFIFSNITCNDLTSIYAHKIKKLYHKSTNFSFIEGDAEALPKEINNLNLIVSGSAFQWFHSLENALHNFRQQLHDNGVIAFSTFGQHNFMEVKEITGVGLDYKTKNNIENIIQEDFELIFSSETIQTLHFKKPINVLQHMKKTGVNSLLGNNKTFNFSNFEKEYSRKFNHTKGLSLTYHPMYFIAKTK